MHNTFAEAGWDSPQRLALCNFSYCVLPIVRQQKKRIDLYIQEIRNTHKNSDDMRHYYPQYNAFEYSIF